mmetsp:Transcript_6877/g.8862  ORF Transcript_6877/g.8862 Transcript_6877/m.8862 type:complete len:136 (-) Transcript_6877:200-607(-)
MAADAGIHIIVVTFSPQVDLVKEVLAAAFSFEITVRGCDKKWDYAGVCEGKQGHIASAFEELVYRKDNDTDHPKCKTSWPITRASTLLIDDDPNNIQAAMKYDTPAILFNPKAAESEFIKEILNLPNISTVSSVQ